METDKRPAGDSLSQDAPQDVTALAMSDDLAHRWLGPVDGEVDVPAALRREARQKAQANEATPGLAPKA